MTSNDQEKNVAETFLGYTFERILGYCTKEPGCGAYKPLYRFFNAINKGGHNLENLSEEAVCRPFQIIFTPLISRYGIGFFCG